MVWWALGFFVAVIGLRMLYRWRHGMPVVPDLSEPAVPPISDPRLGELVYSRDGKCWKSRIPLDDGGSFELSISGRASGPAAAALVAARGLADRAKSGELQGSIKEQVIEAAPSRQDAEDSGLAVARAEMLSLQVESLHVYAAGPPLSCMVFFEEDPSHEGRVWRCLYDGARVTDIVFDS